MPEVLKNVVSMELGSIEIPMTYYQIQRSLGNNHFWFEWNDPSGTADGVDGALNTYYIEIPDGNYQSYEMQLAINYEIIKAIENDPLWEKGTEIADRFYPQCLLNLHTQKFTFFINPVLSPTSTNTTNTLNVYFNKNHLNYSGECIGSETEVLSSKTAPELMVDLKNDIGVLGSIGWILGFRNPDYKKGDPYVSEGCYDGWGNKYLYLVINDYNKNINNVCITSYNKSLGRSNILARIPTKALSRDEFQNGLIIQHNNTTDNSFKGRDYFGPVDINRLEIQLTDEYGRIVDLNWMDLSFSLNITCLYDV